MKRLIVAALAVLIYDGLSAMFGRKAQVAKAGWCQAWVKAPG